jgi:hypothetical protein
MSTTRLAFCALAFAFLLGAQGVDAEERHEPRVTSIAVDPAAALAVPGVEITLASEGGASISCITDERGGCTIDRGLPGSHLVVYATIDGRRGPARRIALPPDGEVLVYVPVQR